ncbi:MAG: hypothetical protein SH848_14215 [Saprospiraceae bacterium]|nr:hypothetical protein [Saprospiraceae bacterium]MDZ4705085.1 hypothetical protein [Saprospiraceae bacterium]
MGTIRLVLKEPLYKYPIGTVFDLLEEQSDIEGSDADERVREKMSYANRMTYFLPDTGRGFSAMIRESNMKPCPKTAFDGTDLRTGPLHVTKTQSGYGKLLQPEPTPLPYGNLQEEQVSLVEIGGHHAQGMNIELPPFSQEPRRVTLRDAQREETLWERAFSDLNTSENTVSLDFSELPPGFYQLFFQFRGDCRHSIQFIKSFPLRVEFNNGLPDGYSLHKTLY